MSKLRIRLTVLSSAISIVVLAAILAGCSTRPQPPLPPAPDSDIAVGYHFGPPAKASIGGGISRVFARQIGRWEPCAKQDGLSGQRTLKVGCNRAVDSIWAPSWHSDREVFLIAEPGLKGARLSLGYAVDSGNQVGSDLSTLRLSFYRRWNSDHDEPGGTYLGVEGAAVGMGAIALGLRAGVFARIAGPAGGARTLLALDFPIGY
jgi:hypothetical protein